MWFPYRSFWQLLRFWPCREVACNAPHVSRRYCHHVSRCKRHQDCNTHNPASVYSQHMSVQQWRNTATSRLWLEKPRSGQHFALFGTIMKCWTPCLPHSNQKLEVQSPEPILWQNWAFKTPTTYRCFWRGCVLRSVSRFVRFLLWYWAHGSFWRGREPLLHPVVRPQHPTRAAVGRSLTERSPC